MTSFPVLVAFSSGVAARLPTMVILAMSRRAEAEKARLAVARRGAAVVRRRARKDIFSFFFRNGKKDCWFELLRLWFCGYGCGCGYGVSWLD